MKKRALSDSIFLGGGGEISAKASSICLKNERANFSAPHYAELLADLLRSFRESSNLITADLKNDHSGSFLNSGGGGEIRTLAGNCSPLQL